MIASPSSEVFLCFDGKLVVSELYYSKYGVTRQALESCYYPCFCIFILSSPREREFEALIDAIYYHERLLTNSKNMIEGAMQFIRNHQDEENKEKYPEEKIHELLCAAVEELKEELKMFIEVSVKRDPPNYLLVLETAMSMTPLLKFNTDIDYGLETKENGAFKLSYTHTIRDSIPLSGRGAISLDRSLIDPLETMLCLAKDYNDFIRMTDRTRMLKMRATYQETDIVEKEFFARRYYNEAKARICVNSLMARFRAMYSITAIDAEGNKPNDYYSHIYPTRRPT